MKEENKLLLKEKEKLEKKLGQKNKRYFRVLKKTIKQRLKNKSRRVI